LVNVCGLWSAWYEETDPEKFVEIIKKSGQRVHLFTFFQRVPDVEPRYTYFMEPYPVAVIPLTNYADWWNDRIGKKVRQMVKKSQKAGVEIRMADFDDEFVLGIRDIYNETPIRQGKPFPHYKDSLEKVREENGTYVERSVFLGAYYQDELIGFTKIVFEEKFADILQLLAKVAHRDKCVTTALLAKAVEYCSSRGAGYLAYGDWEKSGLGDFKRHNGFSRMDLPMYYIPLNMPGELALKLRLHRRYSEWLPEKTIPVLKDLRRRWHEMAASLK
jgi:GNAT superfamily N-acetyltransferase